MLFTTLDRIYHSLFGDFRLSRLLTSVFVFMLVATVALTSYLIIDSNTKIVNSIVDKFAKNIAHEVNTDLTRFLETPAIINANTQHAVKANRINPKNNNSLSRFLWDAAHLNLDHLVSSIYFAGIDGRFISIGVADSDHQEIEQLFSVSAPFTDGRHTDIKPGPNGVLGEPVEVRNPYDPRKRPWFQKAMSNPDEAIWTDIYTDFDSGLPTITRAITVRGDDNLIRGVAAVDLFLEHLQEFLDTLIVSNHTEVFITNGEGLLVAAIAPGVKTDKPSHNIPTEEAPFPFTLAATRYIDNNPLVQAQQDKPHGVSITLEGSDGLLYVSPIGGEYGLNWRLGIFLPKRDFVSSIWEQLKLLVPLILVVLLTAIGSIVGMLSLVVKPIRQLSADTAQIAAGDFSVPIHVRGKNEVGVLAKSFEHMQDNLNSTFRDLLLRDRAIAEVDVGILICDATKANFPILYVNNAMVALTGYSNDEFIGANLLTLEGTDPNHPEIETIKVALENDEPAQVIFESRRKDGVEYIREFAISPVRNDDGETIHYICIQRDITERINTEIQLRRAQKNDAIGQLSGGIAHDFNNLLSIVAGRLELINATVKDGSAQQHVSEAEHAVDMGARLTHRLLAFARQGALEPTVVNLNEQVKSSLIILEPTVGANIKIVSNLDDDIWSTCIDPSEIENTVINLTINARDAMPNGGVIRIDTSNVTLDSVAAQALSLPAGDYVKLTVSDSGTGMTEKTKTHLFEPFYTTKPLDKGTGMGLASIYGFAMQSGGTITVDSALDVGTTFHVYLPRHNELDSNASEQTLRSNVSQTSSNQQLSVLVVEDNRSTREVAVGRLESLGFSVIEADSGLAALSVLESDRKVDLLFCDLVLGGGMSGKEVAQWAHQHNPTCKILLTSGFTDKHLVELSADTPRWRVLQKPYKFNALQEAVESLMK